MNGNELFELIGERAYTLVRLLVAALIGAVLGLDRERKDKPAGLRTHMLVALGSATFVLLGFEVGAHIDARDGEERFDPTRVLQGVVGGIGFLGAGSIIQARGHVSGVTTAASVWMAGALGAAAGMGAYGIAIVATVLSSLILSALFRLERRLRPGGGYKDEDQSDPDLRGAPTQQMKIRPE